MFMNWKRMKFHKTLIPVYVMWVALIAEGFFSLARFQWMSALIAGGTFILTLLPFFLQRRFKLSIPNYFIAAIVFFIAATLFFGEVSDFYYKFWWWDILLHAWSAVGFGILGFVVLLYLVQSSKITASPFLISVFSFSFAVAIGVIWEIFEFAMDQFVGTNMQKSGLVDTMTDLVVDCVGGIIASVSGYFYLRFGKGSIVSSLIHPLLDENRKIFRTKITKIEQVQVETQK